MKKSAKKLRILMVCMGNICRSPMAAVVARTFVARAGLSDRIEIDSAGTHAHHAGEAPDIRAKQVVAKRGYELSRHRARRISASDFAVFDRILAMDRSNLAALEDICPEQHRPKLELFMCYANGMDQDEVPDPYYGSIEGFERVLAMCESASRGLLASCLKEVDKEI